MVALGPPMQLGNSHWQYCVIYRYNKLISHSTNVTIQYRRKQLDSLLSNPLRFEYFEEKSLQ